MREAGRARIHTQAHETPCKGVRHEEGVGKAGTGMRPLSIGVRVWRIRAGVGGSDPDGPLDLWNLDLRARERTQHRVRTNTNLRAYTRARIIEAQCHRGKSRKDVERGVDATAAVGVCALIQQELASANENETLSGRTLFSSGERYFSGCGYCEKLFVPLQFCVLHFRETRAAMYARRSKPSRRGGSPCDSET
ncbi:hypothetical protein KM043_017818 [Ampulex compressa]|nr:hypothetical protein KM043_017818 [Ampulex compressa]